MRSRTALHLGLLTLLTLALHLPFVAQAFHIDDVQFLEMAQNVFQNPFFPLDKAVVFDGQRIDFRAATHPPLNYYFIAGLLLLSDRSPSEVFLHSVFLIFPILAAVSFYFLAREFVGHALLASTLLATNPTLMVSAHTLMADIPLLSMWLCGMALFVNGIHRDRDGFLYASLLPIVAACFFAYQGLAIVPLLTFHALSRRRLGLREVLILSAPLVLIAGWQISGYLHRGVFYASMMFGYMETRGLWQAAVKIKNALASVTYFGGVILLFPFIFWRLGSRWKGMLSWIGLAAGIMIVYQRYASYTWTGKALFVGCFGGGIVAVLWVLIRGTESLVARNWTNGDILFCLWILGVLVACVALFYSGSARYVLPAFPPSVLLLIRADKQRRSSLDQGRLFYGSLIAVQLLLGFTMAHSDYEFAGTGRLQAQEFKARYLGDGQHFLFSGEWGLRHYLTSLGGEIVAEDMTASPGDLFVKSRLCMGRIFDNEFGRSLELVEEKTYRIRSPMRLLDEHSHAGFWSDGWGVLPFSFSREVFDEFSIYRVKGR